MRLQKDIFVSIDIKRNIYESKKNPLQSTFENVRIKIEDIALPFSLNY